MELRVDSLPQISRADVGAILIGEWRVDTVDRQRAAVDASLEAWERHSWPEGLVSHNCFVSTDGATVLHYSQWTSDEAAAACRRGETSNAGAAGSRVREILEAVPGVERLGVFGYRLHRSTVWDAAGTPGCVVVIRFEVDRPELQQRLYDSLASDDPAVSRPHAGLLSSHFHFGVDGMRALNYAEWTEEAAHREFMENVSTAGRRKVIDAVGGVRPLGYRRYRFAGSRTVPPGSG